MNPHYKILLSPENTEGSTGETFRTVGESTDSAAEGEMGSNSGSSDKSGQDENGGQSMLDAVRATLEQKGHKLEEKSEEDSSTSGENKKEELGSDSERDRKEGEEKEKPEGETEGDEGQEDSEDGEEKEEEDSGGIKEKVEKEKVIIPEDKLLEGKDPIPVDRFKEVITQRNDLRMKLQEVDPIVKDWQNINSFCQQNGIDSKQFNQVLEIQALLNTNPAEALKRIEPIVQELKGFTGDSLPKDLQDAVDAGEISVKYAKEVAQSRAITKFGEGKLKHDRESLERRQQAIERQQYEEAAVGWEKATREKDPDYFPKKDKNGPDGKWEMVKTQFIAMLNEVDAQGKPVNLVKTPAEMSALMEKAYQNVQTSLKQFTRRPVTKKPLRSNGDSIRDGDSNSNGKNGKSIEEQPDLQSAVRVGLKQMGHRF